MALQNSTTRANRSKGRDKGPKPAKPYEDFPLFPHANGSWAKKIRGKLHYFGKWSDPDAALQKFLDEEDDLRAGRIPRKRRGDLTLKRLCNMYLHEREKEVEAGRLTRHTWSDYETVCKRLVDHFGGNRSPGDIQPIEFSGFRRAVEKYRLEDDSLKVFLGKTKAVFSWGRSNLLLKQPVEFGTAFRVRKKKNGTANGNGSVNGETNGAKKKTGVRFTREEILRLMADGFGRTATPEQLRTMVLVAVNCGFGQTDLAELPIDAVDLDGGWIEFPRPKNGNERRAKLWPETVEMLRDYLANYRPNPQPEHAHRLFVRCCGGSWRHYLPSGLTMDYTGRAFAGACKRLKIVRPGLNVYGLRRSFRGVAGETLDFPAADYVMGHSPQTMGERHYAGVPDDDRLERVCEHVRQWLFFSPCKKCGEPVHVWHKAEHACPEEADDAGEGG